jgi:transcription antitermination factor NusG
MLDTGLPDLATYGLPDARGPTPASHAPCASYPENPDLFSSSKFAPGLSGFEPAREPRSPGMFLECGHGGARINAGGPRANSGGPRENSGGAREGAGRPRTPKLTAEPRVGPRWYCLRTVFGQEAYADTAVRMTGLEVFNPSEFKAATPARRDAAGVMRPGKPDRVRPLFGRYFLVRFDFWDPAWHLIKRCPGVDRFVSALDSDGCEVPIAVPDRAVEWVRGILETNDCFYPEKLRDKPIDPGTMLRLLEGPMAGHLGVCEASDGLEVRLAMMLMGHLAKATVAQSAVEKV